MLIFNFLLNKLEDLRGVWMEKYELAGLIAGLVILMGFIAWAFLNTREASHKQKGELKKESKAEKAIQQNGSPDHVEPMDGPELAGVMHPASAEAIAKLSETLAESLAESLEPNAQSLQKIQDEIAYASKQAVKKEVSSSSHASTDPFSNGQWAEAVKRTFKVRTDVNARKINDREKMLQGLVIINIMAPGSGFFYGRDVLNILNSLSLRFGELGIFHKFNEKGEKIFSVSQATEPGVFDINNMPLCSIRGLTCFFDLGKVSQPKYAFRSLLASVHEIAHYLKAEILDDKMKPLTQNAITDMLKRIKMGEEKLEEKLEAKSGERLEEISA